jgi:hypothetical protein
LAARYDSRDIRVVMAPRLLDRPAPLFNVESSTGAPGWKATKLSISRGRLAPGGRRRASPWTGHVLDRHQSWRPSEAVRGSSSDKNEVFAISVVALRTSIDGKSPGYGAAKKTNAPNPDKRAIPPPWNEGSDGVLSSRWDQAVGRPACLCRPRLTIECPLFVVPCTLSSIFRVQL